MKGKASHVPIYHMSTGRVPHRTTLGNPHSRVNGYHLSAYKLKTTTSDSHSNSKHHTVILNEVKSDLTW